MNETNSMNLIDIYEALLQHFGYQYWWPAKTKFEIIIGAILTQQTAWQNVEKAIANLKKSNLLDVASLSSAKRKVVESCIRPSGFYKQKAGRIIGISKYIVDNNGGDVDNFLKSVSRKELLAINGVGKETADSILLYAANRKIFPIDAYTFRILSRIGITNEKNYDELQKFFHGNLPKNLRVYNEFHALLVKLGKTFCKKKPNCQQCPIKECNNKESTDREFAFC